jgi:hypothetical protein
VWDSCPEALSQEGQFILLIAPSIDPLHPLGSARRLNCWCAFIESTPSGTSSVRLNGRGLVSETWQAQWIDRP